MLWYWKTLELAGARFQLKVRKSGPPPPKIVLHDSTYSALYIDEPYGRGITPANFAAYKAQRFRWAFGAMQILKRHGTGLLRADRLSPGQRYHFATGWLPWLADAVHPVFTLMAVVLSISLLFVPIWNSLPYQLFVIQASLLLAGKLVFGLVLHRARVRCQWRDTLGMVISTLALTHAVARGTLHGLVARHHPFMTTEKRPSARPATGPGRAVHEEFALFVMLWLCILALLVYRQSSAATDLIWCAILMLQSAPYAAAMYTEWLSSHDNA